MTTSTKDQDQIIKYITDTVNYMADAAEEDAAMSGSWGDGGASEKRAMLEVWLDGFKFARTGKTETYDHLVKQQQREIDPDYARYLELKKKFEDE